MSVPEGQDLQRDIILVVGEDEVRIAASSQFLCLVSKPFSKMLGPNFKEGQPGDATTKKEISLPEDKPSTMERMCNIIHLQIHGSSPVPTAAELHDLAILSDKYDCVQATSLAARAWIRPSSSHNTDDLGLLLVSASIYTLPEAFDNISSSLVLNHQGSYRVLENVPGFVEFLGWETMRKQVPLFDRRSELSIVCSETRREAQSGPRKDK